MRRLTAVWGGMQGALEARNSIIEYMEIEKVQSLTTKDGNSYIQVRRPGSHRLPQPGWRRRVGSALLQRPGSGHTA